MRHANRSPRRLATLQRQFAQIPGLPFADVLTADTVQHAVAAENVAFRHRLLTPVVTLWTFLSQILDPDHSCRQAVARLLSWRCEQDLPPCSPRTGAYCQARQRLPENVLARLARHTGRELLMQAPVGWLWHGRDVTVVDGTTLSMPDTPANQKAWPQPRTQKPGCGFPLLRMVVLFSFAVGTVLDAAFSPYRGKQTGEPALLRALHHQFVMGDLLLADRYYCSYWELAWAVRRGVDVVMRKHQRRPTDYRSGTRLGCGDHLITWSRPKRPDWMNEATYADVPPTLTVREVRVTVTSPGARTRELHVVTTLLDPAEASAAEIALLYRGRWQAELNLRSLKITLGMDVLRCQSPEMVRKEIWGHLLVYNLLRTLIAQAASRHDLQPWAISFKGALQTLNAFAALLRNASSADLPKLAEQLLAALAAHQVGDRPDRQEPRARKRRPKKFPVLNTPQSKWKTQQQERVRA